MKLLIAVLSLATVAFAQLETLVEHEVKVIVGANPGITVDKCSEMCDVLFDLVDIVDEQLTDDMCRDRCDCEINQNCKDAATTTSDPQTTEPPTTMPPATTQDQNTQGPTTQAPHHTHPPHPTHPTHPTHPPHPDHGHHG